MSSMILDCCMDLTYDKECHERCYQSKLIADKAYNIATRNGATSVKSIVGMYTFKIRKENADSCYDAVKKFLEVKNKKFQHYVDVLMDKNWNCDYAYMSISFLVYNKDQSYFDEYCWWGK